MKKAAALIIIFLSFGFLSCKKSYSCACTTTVTFPGKAPYESSNVQFLGQKSTKKQAESVCRASEAQLNDHFQQQLKDPSANIGSTSVCTIK